MGSDQNNSTDRQKVSRRLFLEKTGAAVASLGLVSPLALARSESEPLRIALIGAGGRMSALLTSILAESAVEIVACADPSPKNLNEKLDRIERATGKRPQGYTGEHDYIQILRRDDVQAAVSATPCDLHAAIYLAALENGKHMYGEKPACLTVEESKQLLQAQKQNPDTILQIGFQRRANRRYIDGVKLIHAGEIGELVEARAAWNNTGGPLGVGRWVSSRARTGDWMLEQACHTWDVLHWVTGELPVATYGAGRRDVYKHIAPERDMTDTYSATLEYASGLIVNYHHTWSAPRNDRGAFAGVYERIAGLKGGIDLGAGRISYTDPDRAPVLLHEKEPDMTASSIKNFFTAVREAKQPISTLECGVNATLTGLLVRKAVDERRRVLMEEILEG